MRGLALAVLLTCVSPAGADDEAMPGWLAGHWQMQDGDVVVDEVWLEPRDGLMTGMSRTSGRRKPFFEFVRIERRADAIYYVAQPLGRPPTEFRAIEAGPDEIVFENPAHDFPQRVRYRRDADGSIAASIEGEVGGAARTERWHYRRAQPTMPAQGGR